MTNPQPAVAAGHEETTRAAAVILRAGGNAFDAAVAAGFVSAVAEPVLTSLGGGGFLLARTSDGREVLFDFFVDTPGHGGEEPGERLDFFPVTVHFGASEQVFHIGLGSVAVPANLKGYVHVHERLGRLPLRDVIAPAAHLARNGVRVNARQAYLFALVEPILTARDDGRRLYAPRGRPLREGDRLVNPDLAELLNALPEAGVAVFYAGECARRIATDMRGRGLLTAKDLEGFQVIERSPLCATYRGKRVLTNPPPSVGGSLIALSLELLQQHDVPSLVWGGADHLGLLTAVLCEVDRQRARGGTWSEGATLTQATERILQATRGTTHISVADAEGNVASMTTSNGEGSGYIAPGTGIMLNNMLGEDDLHPSGFHSVPAGQRVASMMSPSIVLNDESGDCLVVGSGGSKRIRTAILQVVSHCVDFGLSVRDAVDAPRLHWDGEALQVEPGFDESTIRSLRRRWPVNAWPGRNLYFGGVNAISLDGEAAADPRRGGHALVL